MIKRSLDIILSITGLIFSSFILLPVLIRVWSYDKKSPFYISQRVGKNCVLFDMIKLRTMFVGADKTGVDSTGDNDHRITPIGHKIRKFKLDEITQLWNVLLGDMSLVGPRPNVKKETDLYTQEEKGLLSVKPGITDFSSIVFSDEGKILQDKNNPDIAYNQLIRPWKSRLGLIYIRNQSTYLDIQIMFFTLVALVSKNTALKYISKILEKLRVDEKVIDISKRKSDLIPYPPPGSNKIVDIR